MHQRHDQTTSQLDDLRRHNRELKQQLQQQDELQETIGNLNQEVGDLRLRLSHSHARGGTETSTLSTGEAGMVGVTGTTSGRAKRSLATELGGDLDEEEEEDEAHDPRREEHVEGDDGVTTIYHTTTVRRVVVSFAPGSPFDLRLISIHRRLPSDPERPANKALRPTRLPNGTRMTSSGPSPIRTDPPLPPRTRPL